VYNKIYKPIYLLSTSHMERHGGQCYIDGQKWRISSKFEDRSSSEYASIDGLTYLLTIVLWRWSRGNEGAMDPNLKKTGAAPKIFFRPSKILAGHCWLIHVE